MELSIKKLIKSFKETLRNYSWIVPNLAIVQKWAIVRKSEQKWATVYLPRSILQYNTKLEAITLLEHSLKLVVLNFNLHQILTVRQLNFQGFPHFSTGVYISGYRLQRNFAPRLICFVTNLFHTMVFVKLSLHPCIIAFSYAYEFFVPFCSKHFTKSFKDFLFKIYALLNLSAKIVLQLSRWKIRFCRSFSFWVSE